MMTAPFMTDFHNQIRPEYLDRNCWDSQMYSFALGALDAPETMAAGSHYRYECYGYSFIMPSGALRGR